MISPFWKDEFTGEKIPLIACAAWHPVNFLTAAFNGVRARPFRPSPWSNVVGESGKITEMGDLPRDFDSGHREAARAQRMAFRMGQNIARRDAGLAMLKTCWIGPDAEI